MADLTVNLDRLAMHLKSKLESEGLSLRTAAMKMGVGAATLARLLQGSKNQNVPDLTSVNRAAVWVGKSLSEFSDTSTNASTIADVEVQLRALPGLAKQDIEGLVAMVKASYERAKELRAKKKS